MRVVLTFLTNSPPNYKYCWTLQKSQLLLSSSMPLLFQEASNRPSTHESLRKNQRATTGEGKSSEVKRREQPHRAVHSHPHSSTDLHFRKMIRYNLSDLCSAAEKEEPALVPTEWSTEQRDGGALAVTVWRWKKAWIFHLHLYRWLTGIFKLGSLGFLMRKSEKSLRILESAP